MQQIQSTKNYKQFKKLSQNRPLHKSHLFKLTNSILGNNLLEYNPILVNNKMEVIDGQHRLEVAKNNDLEIFYMVIDTDGLEEVVTQNVTRRIWTTDEYLNYWIQRGKTDYAELKDFMEKNQMKSGVAMLLLTGKIYKQHVDSVRLLFKHGEFIVTHKQEADDLVEKMAELTPYTAINLLFDRELWRALAVIAIDGDWDRFSKNLEKAKPRLTRQSNRNSYLFELEQVYNYNQKSEMNRVNFR